MDFIIFILLININQYVTFQDVSLTVGKVGTKSKEDAPHELESQFVLRLPQVSLFLNFTVLY